MYVYKNLATQLYYKFGSDDVNLTKADKFPLDHGLSGGGYFRVDYIRELKLERKKKLIEINGRKETNLSN